MCRRISSVCVICGIWSFNLNTKRNQRVYYSEDNCGTHSQTDTAATAAVKLIIVKLLPEFLLRQVELHVFIFLVLFIQLPQRRICRLISRLLHESFNILLGKTKRFTSMNHVPTENTLCCFQGLKPPVGSLTYKNLKAPDFHLVTDNNNNLGSWSRLLKIVLILLDMYATLMTSYIKCYRIIINVRIFPNKQEPAGMFTIA